MLQKIIVQFLVYTDKTCYDAAGNLSRYRLAKSFKAFKVTAVRALKDFILITSGIFSASFGLESFLLPNKFIDGGVTGISLLVTELTFIPLPWLLVAINLPFIFMGFHSIGRAFAIKTAVAVTCLAIVLATVHFPEVTKDKLLVAVFGGFFLGAGIGLAIRGGAVLDGTEVLAIYLSRKLYTSVGDFIIIFNILIFSSAAYLLSIEQALYSMITYIAASKIVNFVVEGIEEYVGIQIISVHCQEIRVMITEKMRCGVTLFKGRGGYGKKGIPNEIDILYTVVTRLELSRLMMEVQKIDEGAFIVTTNVKSISGGVVKKRRLAH
ncbi:MAG: YitT family protein [Microscillaceae bacterium]|nr:YitT family protein [Microscillaceae bacterium]MDW8460074.1 YitT family protein [Cytophagales bacterium]